MSAKTGKRPAGRMAGGILAVLGVLAGCGQESGWAERHPFLVSVDESWRVSRAMLEKVTASLQEGDVDGFRTSLAIRARGQFPAEKLREDYENHKEEFVNRVRTAKLMHVVPPNLDSPFIDMKILHHDNAIEWWRLAYEEKEWRIQKMGLTILDLEYNTLGAAGPGR